MRKRIPNPVWSRPGLVVMAVALMVMLGGATLAFGAGTTAVFHSSDDTTVQIGDTTEIDIYAEDIDDVGAYTLVLELDNTDAVEIVDLEAAGDPEIQSVDPVGDDGEVASLSVVYGENATDGNGDDLVLATVTIGGLDEGETTLSTTMEAIGNGDGLSYDIDVETDTIDVTAVFSPDAAFTVTPEEPVPNEAATFDASETTTLADDIVEFRWDFTGDGTVDDTTSDAVATFAYDDAGAYDVILEVEDSDGDTDDVTQTILVSERGELTGQVTDALDDAAIEAVDVTVIDDGEIAGQIKTDANGQYALDVRVGTHAVEFDADGYGTVSESDVEVVAEETTTLDVALFPEGDGTADEPYVVANLDDLQAIQDDPDAHYILVSDIDASDTQFWNNGHGFDPITDFTGSFDGQGHEITGLEINRLNEGEVGLFGTTNGATIENVDLVDVSVRGDGWAVGAVVGYAEENTHLANITVTGEVVDVDDAGWAVGGIAGAIYYDSSIENVHTDVDVTGGWAVGGIAGEFGDTQLRDSTTSGQITGGGYVGGAIGFDWWTEDGESSITNTTAHADVESSGWGAGGLIGGSGSNVMDSSATGDVTSSSAAAGGLVGEHYWGEINRSSAAGTVTGSGSSGGLVGWNNALVNQSTASGDVSGDGDTGGLVGQNWNVTTQSYATGSVSGPDTLGGLVGQNGGIVIESFATGAVDDGDSSGGLIGLHDADAHVHDSYWDVETTEQDGGIGEDERDDGPSLIDVSTTDDDEIVGLTTDEMTGAAAVQAMSALDFEAVWIPLDSSYPALSHEPVEPISEPIAAFATDPVSPVEGQETTFDASRSLAPDTEIVAYEWDFTGDGTIDETTSQATATHTYADGGDYDVTLTIETANGDVTDVTDSVAVEAPSGLFEVMIDEDSSELHVTEGENITVAVDIENTASVADTQPVQLQIGGELIDSTDVTLDGNTETTVELTWETSPDQHGTYDIDVVTAADHDSATIVLDESIGVFEVEVIEVNSPVEHGENLTVEAQIENTGDGTDQQLIMLTIDGGPVDGIPVILEPGATTAVTFEVPTTNAPLGEFTYAVHSNDDYDGGTFLILEDPDAPLATFTTSPDEGFAEMGVTFDASESLSPNGVIEEYRWDFTGDGEVDEITTDPVTTHTYDEVGTYDVELTVEDETGVTASITQPYTVIAAEEITDCTTIWQSGAYVVTDELSTDQTGGTTCLRVTADDVTIDGMGHNITAGAPIEWRGSNIGVEIDGATGVSISNLTVQDWNELGTAVMISDSYDVHVQDVTAINNTFGLRTSSVTEFEITDVQAIDNERAGIQLLSSSDGVVLDATASGNAEADGWTNVYLRGGTEDVSLDNVTATNAHTNASGIRVTSNSQNVVITNSVAIGNDGTGLQIESPQVEIADTVVSDNKWGLNATATGVVPVDHLSIDETDEMALSVEASTTALRANTTVPAHPDLDVVGSPVDAWMYGDDEIDIHIHYNPDALGGYDLETLKLKAYEDGEWSTVDDATVDTDEKTVSVSNADFSTLGLFATAGEPGDLTSFDVEPVSDPVVQGEPLEVQFVNAVDANGDPYTTGDDTLTNIDVEHPYDDDPRRVAVEFVDGEATHTFEVLDGTETEDLDLGEYTGLEAWDVNDPRISDTYAVEVVATRLVSFDVQPLNESVLQGDSLEVEFVNAVDVNGEPYTTGDDTLTNIDVEHPLDEDPRRVAVEFVDGEATHTFEVLDAEETEDLDLGEYTGLEVWDVNDPNVRDTYDVTIVATRLASFDIEPVSDPIVQGEPLEVEFVNAVDVNGEPYTTGDDSWTNFDVEHPLDDDPRRVAVEFVDGEALQTFEVLDEDETLDVSPDFYDGLEAWDVNDPTINDTYGVLIEDEEEPFFSDDALALNPLSAIVALIAVLLLMARRQR